MKYMFTNTYDIVVGWKNSASVR